MPNDAVHNSSTNKISRICYLAQKAGQRKVKYECNAFDKRVQKDSKAFTQRVLLYLAEASQIRHQRDMKLSRLTKMFNVDLDKVDPHFSNLLFKRMERKKLKNDALKAEADKEPIAEKTDIQKAQRGESMGSEISNVSFSFEEDAQNFRSSRRERALSVGFLDEISESEDKRRLSAPEVVITPVAKSVPSSPLEKFDDNLGVSSTHLTPQNSVSDQEDISPALSYGSPSSSNIPPNATKPKKGPSGTKKRTKSPFRTYSHASSVLRRLGSHDSSTTRRKSTKQSQILSQEEISNPTEDERFLELLSSLQIMSERSEDVSSVVSGT